MKTAGARYHASMAGTVDDLVAAAKTAASNQQAAVDAGRAVAAHVAGTRMNTAPAPTAAAPVETSVPQAGT